MNWLWAKSHALIFLKKFFQSVLMEGNLKTAAQMDCEGFAGGLLPLEGMACSALSLSKCTHSCALSSWCTPITIITETFS